VTLDVPIVKEVESTSVAIGPPDIANTRQRPSSFLGNMRKRPPKNVAVMIKSNSDDLSYAIIKRAKEGVDLKQLGIINPRMCRAAMAES